MDAELVTEGKCESVIRHKSENRKCGQPAAIVLINCRQGKHLMCERCAEVAVMSVETLLEIRRNGVQT